MLCGAGGGVAWQRGDGLARPRRRGAGLQRFPINPGTLCSHTFCATLARLSQALVFQQL